MQARSVDISEGLNWYAGGWKLFMHSPAMWLLMFILLAVIGIVLMLVPFIGQPALVLIGPALGAGFYFAAQQADGGGEVEPAMLFEGLRNPARRNPLLVLGALLLAISIAATLLGISVIGASILTSMLQSDTVQMALGPGQLLGLLAVLAIQLLAIMAMFYAIPLVMLAETPPLTAVQLSFSGCLKNLLPLLVFGVIYLVLAIIAAIPLALGFLLLIPVSLLASYCSYRSVFA